MIDFEKIPKKLKYHLINLVLIPFWIISIYLFGNELYIANDFLIISCLCFCLTLCSYIVSSFLISLWNFNPEVKKKELIIFSIFFQTMFLSALIFLGYVFNLICKLKFEFYSFIITYFVSISLLLFIGKFGKINWERKKS
ncbi:hypothetical protein CW731_05365 [Polaribacter sp. ALD11]|nr:hypothetical protein CW731_05365 [Polaribacter sp. ALD11]